MLILACKPQSSGSVKAFLLLSKYSTREKEIERNRFFEVFFFPSFSPIMLNTPFLSLTCVASSPQV